MSFDNQKGTLRMMWMIIVMTFIILAFSFICIFLRYSNISVYVTLMFLLALLAFKFLKLKYFKMEISDELIYISSYTPLKNLSDLTILEQPLDKIYFCKLEKSILSHYICVVVSCKNRNEMFYYEVGTLSKRRITEINNSFNKINESNKTVRSVG